MPRVKRSLVQRDMARIMDEDDFLPRVEAALADCPEAAQITDDEAEDFFLVSQYLEGVSLDSIRLSMRKAGIPVPTEISFDEYRLGRHIFRRWGDPKVKEAMITRGLQLENRALARLFRRRDPEHVRKLLEDLPTAALFAIFRRYGSAELIELARQQFDEGEQARYRGVLKYLKVLLYRFMTEPEPPRRPTRWDRAKLARRLNLREVQMRAMRKSVHHLRRERKALISRLRETSQQEQPELQSLAAQLTNLRAARAEAEAVAAAEREELIEHHLAELARMRTELADLQQDLAGGLAERGRWLTAGKGGPLP